MVKEETIVGIVVEVKFVVMVKQNILVRIVIVRLIVVIIN
jgi:hypothetical protein